MLLEKIKLTAEDLKLFDFEFEIKPDLLDKVDYGEKYGTIKISGADIRCIANELNIVADFEIDYKIDYSFGDFYTPSYTDLNFHTPLFSDWKITDDDGNEVELDTKSEVKLELSLMKFIENTYC